MKIYIGMFLAFAGFLFFIIYSTLRERHHQLIQQETLLYQKGLTQSKDWQNPYNIEAQLNYYDSLAKTPSKGGNESAALTLLLANTLLKAGQEKQAITILEKLDKEVQRNPLGRLTMETEKLLALAFLRLGERNNCIANHTMASCIFPVEGMGVFSDPYASLQAVDLYQKVLQVDSSDLESRWLLNLAYMTIGTYPQKVPGKWLIPNLDLDTSSFKLKPFADLAGGLGLDNSRHMAGGAIVDDFNNDGYLDIVTSGWGLDESMHYYRNNGDGTFTDMSEASGLSKIKGGLTIMQADYNNDGNMDILVLRGAWLQQFGTEPMTLLRNNGNGTFTDVTVESGLLFFGPTQAATWADFNNDGWLDLFVGAESEPGLYMHPSALFINNQDGTFTNVAARSGCAKYAFMKGAVSADYNRDGWPDIFISCLDGREILLKNLGVKSKIPQFEDATAESGLSQYATHTFAAWFWDYNNDGWPDIFACSYTYEKAIVNSAAAAALGLALPQQNGMFLFRNNRNGTFTNVGDQVGFHQPVFAMGANFGDFDNDGWLDMYLGTGNPDFRSLVPNKMFKNVQGKFFADVTASARVGNLQKGHGVAIADLNNDGWQDIFEVMGGAFPGDGFYNSLYVNPGQNGNKWISVQLEGTKSNRCAIGAHIEVSFTDSGVKRTVYMDVNSGGSFGCSPLRKEIGIGKARKIDELTIRWPTSGIVQTFNNIAPCQFLKIKEGSPQIIKLTLRTFEFKPRQAGTMNMTM